MEQVLKDIEYRGIFKYFEEVCNVPRGSRYNKLISDYLVQFAKDNNLRYRQDDALNVVIFKEATKGYENCPTMIIQGHMDMVCEKAAHVEHDFTTEPLELIVEGDYIRANGTTLGGDDGIAIAYAMAALTDDTIVHPNLEVIITTDEEIGMIGATALDTSDLKGKFMLNVDSEEEGILLSSCAGGLTASLKLPLAYEETSGTEIKIQIAGLQGGHSGTEINKNRVNATRLLGRLMYDLRKREHFSVITMAGGSKDNVIPREASASILVKKGQTEQVKKSIELLAENYVNEYKTKEPDLKITPEVKDGGFLLGITDDSLDKLLFMLLNTPNSIQEMSADIEGLVESSLNLGIFQIKNKVANFGYAVRSSFDSYKQLMSDKLKMVCDMTGASFQTSGEYSAWEYNKDSELRELMRTVYVEQYGHEPKIEAIHAGLECGVIASKIEGIDIVSFGPDLYDIHTPKERMSISSAKRVYDYIVTVLEAVCKKYV